MTDKTYTSLQEWKEDFLPDTVAREKLDEAWQACSQHYEARIKELEDVISAAYDTFNANEFTEDETLAMRMCKQVLTDK